MADLQTNDNGEIVLIDDNGNVDTQDAISFVYFDTSGKLQLSSNTIKLKNVAGTTIAELAAVT
jgi:hypothetical protein